MFTNATPGASPPTAATPTMAQSWARRLNFSNAQPAPSVFGTRTSVMISSGASAVSRKPRKKSSAAITRSPPLPRTTMLPPEREDHRGQVRRGVAVRERPAERAAVADLRVADLARGCAQDRDVLPHQRVVLDVVVPGEPTDGELVAARRARTRGRRAGRRRPAPTASPTAASSVAAASARRRGAWRRRRARPAARSPRRRESAPGVGERCRDHRSAPAISAEPATTAATMLW